MILISAIFIFSCILILGGFLYAAYSLLRDKTDMEGIKSGITTTTIGFALLSILVFIYGRIYLV